MVIDSGIRISLKGFKMDWVWKNKITSGKAAGNFGLKCEESKHRKVHL